jgi:transposase
MSPTLATMKVAVRRTPMSAKELGRVAVVGRVAAGTLSLGSAATMLGVSYRQMKRIAKRFREAGARGLRHGSAGGVSNHARPTRERARILALIAKKYSGAVGERFGPTLAAEHLASEDGIAIHHDTLRRWMADAGLWSRQRKRTPYRQRRARKAHFGELVQLDGSFHRWYEGRGPQRCLITMVDDATSRSAGRFSAEETIWAAAAVLRRWIEAHGVPLALYTDWKNVYVRAATAAEQAAGLVPLTQFGRMCAALHIQIIPASSPQAKGRVERNHGTHQDRLVKKLRRLAITADGPANAFLETTYWPQHNARFPQAPASMDDFHRRSPSATTLDRIFRLEETRTVGQDWVVRYHNRALQLARQSGYAPARSTVTVCEWPDGRLAIEYRRRAMQWREVTGQTDVTHGPGAVAPPPAPPPRSRGPRAGADHPWRQTYQGIRADVPLWQVADR